MNWGRRRWGRGKATATIVPSEGKAPSLYWLKKALFLSFSLSVFIQKENLKWGQLRETFHSYRNSKFPRYLATSEETKHR